MEPRDGMKTRKVSIYLTAKMISKIEHLAGLRGLKRNEYIKKLLAEEIEAYHGNWNNELSSQ